MRHESLSECDWASIVERLGGAARLAESARETGAFRRARGIASATILLRLLLAYSLGNRGLRSTAAWAASMDLADVSNVAVLYRLRVSGDWFAHLIGVALAEGMPKAAAGRPIRILDGTTVPKAGGAGKHNALWRIHGCFDVATERFAAFELTDQSGGERLDRIAVTKGEIRLADRCFMQPDRIAAVLDQGADIVIRAGWKSASWQTADGAPFDLVAALEAAGKTANPDGIDMPIHVGRKGGASLALRLVAQRGGHTLSRATLAAADWVIIVTSLGADAFTSDDVLALYRLRWRIELAFKRLKSLIGLKGPPGTDGRSARPYLLAHLLLILLLEPLVDRFEDSPHWANAA
jgi:hypothetical protein